jgi:hypothetical protein
MLTENAIFTRHWFLHSSVKESKQNAWVKWGLLKVKEREIHREHVGMQVEFVGRNQAFFFSRCF